MTAHSSETSEHTESTDGTESGATARAQQALSSVADRRWSGSAAMLTGGALLARARRSSTRGRMALQGIAGAALLGYGLKQRLSGGEADATRQPGDVTRETDVNPRGTSDEPDVDSENQHNTGKIQFSDDQDDEPRSSPHLEDGPEDPRFEDEPDDEVDVDLSEAAMADEASEAAGPSPEQAEPTQTDDTEPERTDPDDTPNVAGADPDEFQQSVGDDEFGSEEPEYDAGDDDGTEEGRGATDERDTEDERDADDRRDADDEEDDSFGTEDSDD